MLYLYTEEFFFLGKIKRKCKAVLGMINRGPEAVARSLKRGLDALQKPYHLNSAAKQPSQENIAVVLNGVKVLRWAIAQKRAGKIQKLVAGPNIVVTPLDYNYLITDPVVDIYLVPAQWSVDWWVSLIPTIKEKLAVWPAGVENRGELVNPQGQVLILQKNAPLEVLNQVKRTLQKFNLLFAEITYGHFDSADYFRLLKKSKFMVYLSQSESQGLALHEAWMAGVPTLVWNRGFMQYRRWRWEEKKISAPYLSVECGRFFYGTVDFEETLTQFLENYHIYKPRAYSLRNFTDKISAQKFLQIISV